MELVNNIDEMIDIVSLMLDQKVVYFSNDIYRIFVKRDIQ